MCHVMESLMASINMFRMRKSTPVTTSCGYSSLDNHKWPALVDWHVGFFMRAASGTEEILTS